MLMARAYQVAANVRAHVVVGVVRDAHALGASAVATLADKLEQRLVAEPEPLAELDDSFVDVAEDAIRRRLLVGCLAAVQCLPPLRSEGKITLAIRGFKASRGGTARVS